MHRVRFGTQLHPISGTNPTTSHVANYFRLHNFQPIAILGYRSAPKIKVAIDLAIANSEIDIFLSYVRICSFSFIEHFKFDLILAPFWMARALINPIPAKEE